VAPNLPSKVFSPAGGRLGEKNDDREFLEQTDGKVDVFVQGISTGGSVAGIAEIDKRNPNVKGIGIQLASLRGG